MFVAVRVSQDTRRVLPRSVSIRMRSRAAASRFVGRGAGEDPGGFARRFAGAVVGFRIGSGVRRAGAGRDTTVFGLFCPGACPDPARNDAALATLAAVGAALCAPVRATVAAPRPAAFAPLYFEVNFAAAATLWAYSRP